MVVMGENIQSNIDFHPCSMCYLHTILQFFYRKTGDIGTEVEIGPPDINRIGTIVNGHVQPLQIPGRDNQLGVRNDYLFIASDIHNV